MSPKKMKRCRQIIMIILRDRDDDRLIEELKQLVNDKEFDTYLRKTYNSGSG